jgi:flagellar biogenesis protein FliO
MGKVMGTEAVQLSSEKFRAPAGGLWTGLWARVLRLGQRTPKRLRLCESLPLGERRFVAVVEFERTRFLVGGTPSSLVLLSRLEDSRERTETTEDDKTELTKNGRSQKC